MNGFVGMSPVSNEDILYTLAQVATTLAGFSGLVVVFRVRGAQAWSRAELRTFWFLLGDSFLVLFFSLITPLLYGMSAAIHVTAKPTRSGARRGTDSRLIRGVNPLCWMSWSDQVVRH